MDAAFTLRGEVPLFSSLQLAREFWGCGSFELHLHPKAPGAEELQQDRILFPAGQCHKACIIEDVTRTATELVVSGCQLKGIVKRRLCVPPISLPTHLWTYMCGAWVEVEESEKRQIMADPDISVYEGYSFPASPATGMYFIDMSEVGTVYDWQQTQGTGAVWFDLDTAHLRSKYQDFGYDSVIGAAETAMKHYVDANCVTVDAARRLPGLTIEPDGGRGAVLPWQARFDGLDALLSDIGEKTGMGWDIVPDLTAGGFVMRCHEPACRTEGSGTVVFSVGMGNAAEVKLSCHAAGCATTAYVGGAGEDENRLILSVGGGTVGLARRETWVDGGSMDDIDMLTMAAQSKLTASAPTVTLTASVLDHGGCRYERDWNLGDRVLVDSGDACAAQQITAVRETYEHGKSRVIEATFGTGVVTLGRRLRAKLGASVR